MRHANAPPSHKKRLRRLPIGEERRLSNKVHTALSDFAPRRVSHRELSYSQGRGSRRRRTKMMRFVRRLDGVNPPSIASAFFAALRSSSIFGLKWRGDGMRPITPETAIWRSKLLSCAARVLLTGRASAG